MANLEALNAIIDSASEARSMTFSYLNQIKPKIASLKGYSAKEMQDAGMTVELSGQLTGMISALEKVTALLDTEVNNLPDDIDIKS